MAEQKQHNEARMNIKGNCQREKKSSKQLESTQGLLENCNFGDIILSSYTNALFLCVFFFFFQLFLLLLSVGGGALPGKSTIVKQECT
jgi:hypothetical protein